MQPNSSQKRALIWGCIIAGGILLLWLLGAVLAPFAIAAVLAYMLHPMVQRLVRLRLPLWMAVAMVEVMALVAVLGFVFLVVPVLSRELPVIREQLPQLLANLQQALQPLVASFGLKLEFDVAAVKAFAVKYFSANGEDLFGQALSSLRLGGSVALALVGNLVLVPVALFYLLHDWQSWTEALVRLVPPRMLPSVEGFFRETDGMLRQYLRGQISVMVLLAVFYALGLALVGLDLAVPIGIFTGLAMFVPYVGFGIGLVLALLAGSLQFGLSGLFLVGLVFGLGQIIEGLILTPRLVGERIGLHPLAVIFALLAFGQLLGFVGVLVALPASAVLAVGVRRIRVAYFASELYRSGR